MRMIDNRRGLIDARGEVPVLQKELLHFSVHELTSTEPPQLFTGLKVLIHDLV